MTAPTLNASRKTKKTHIGELPVDWAVCKLGEVAKINARTLSENTPPEFSFYYLDLSAVGEGKISYPKEKIQFCTSPSRARRQVTEGDVIMSTVRPNLDGHGLIDRDTDDLVCSTGFAVLSQVLSADIRFIYHLLFSRIIHQQIDWLTSGSSYPAINPAQVASLLVPQPPLHEQREIAAVLETWDQAIGGQEQLLTAKQQFKQALMQQLLTGKMRFKNSTGKEWKRYRLSELLERVYRPVTLTDDAPLDLISIRRRAGGLFFRGSFTAREFKTLDLNRIEAGDFLVSKRQVTHGALAMVRKDFERMHVSNEYVIFRRKHPDKLYLPFFDWLSRSPRMWHMAYLASNGVHIEKLIFDADDFLKEKISLPPSLSEQQKIVEVLETSDAEIRILERELAVLRDQKRGLMQKLLTGKVRVKS